MQFQCCTIKNNVIRNIIYPKRKQTESVLLENIFNILQKQENILKAIQETQKTIFHFFIVYFFLIYVKYMNIVIL
jgi:hypothetical protein